MSRAPIKVTVRRMEVYSEILEDTGSRGDRLTDLIAWLKSELTAIPKPYRNSARLEWESVGGWEGEHHVEAHLYYELPQTDAEVAEQTHDPLRRRRVWGKWGAGRWMEK